MSVANNRLSDMVIPWDQIYLRWLQGESCYAISQSLGGHPTRQAIAKRARREEWNREVDGVVSEKHLRKHAATIGKDTPETRERIIELLSKGANYKLAAGAVGIDVSTLSRWRKQDPQFAMRCRQARHQMLADCTESIHAARNRDWKAAKHLLETAPETRDDFRPERGNGHVEVVINIERDEPRAVTIEGMKNRHPNDLSGSVSEIEFPETEAEISEVTETPGPSDFAQIHGYPIDKEE